MRKPITAKDVLYALEYLNDRLVMHPGGKWRLQSGQPVPPRVAYEAKSHGGVVGIPDHSGLAVYGWARAA